MTLRLARQMTKSRHLDCTEPLRLNVVRQKNGGVAAARNRGLEEADQTTTLIAFLDSDDIWPANHLARAIQALDNGIDFYLQTIGDPNTTVHILTDCAARDAKVYRVQSTNNWCCGDSARPHGRANRERVPDPGIDGRL